MSFLSFKATEKKCYNTEQKGRKIMKIDPIYLTKEDVINLNSKKIAAGTEGTIYRIKPGTLYKIYHDYNDNICGKSTSL